MTNKHRIYLIIQQRRSVSLQDLYDITRLNKMSVLKAVSILTVKRKIKAIQDHNGRYFHIIDKPLKNG
jgi:hypothetical protein